MIMNEKINLKDSLSKAGQEQVKKIQKAIEEADKPKILTEIKMRKGEEDIRQLSEGDKAQLNHRLMCDLWLYNKAQHDSLVTITLVLLEIAKKLGINIEEKLNDYYDANAPIN